MRLVVASYGSQVGFDSTLQGAIKNLVAKGGEQPQTPNQPNQPPELTPELAAAAAKIQAAIDKLQAAQQSGDFKTQGEALAELDAAMKEFEAASGGSGTPAPTPSPTPTG
jgi:uncharacterized membrane protein (UPF0182 family)